MPSATILSDLRHVERDIAWLHNSPDEDPVVRRRWLERTSKKLDDLRADLELERIERLSRVRRTTPMDFWEATK